VLFTDHSLVGFSDPASIALNKTLKFTLADAHAVICVSHTSRENTVLRACLPPRRVYVIPNGAHCTSAACSAPADHPCQADTPAVHMPFT
jgi:Glycosyltransferase Family 4